MSEENRLNVPAARVAAQIQALDSRLDDMRQRSRIAADADLLELGPATASELLRARRDERDQEHQALVDERADLLVQLELLDDD
jgi:hypothetical protein